MLVQGSVDLRLALVGRGGAVRVGRAGGVVACRCRVTRLRAGPVLGCHRPAAGHAKARAGGRDAIDAPMSESVPVNNHKHPPKFEGK